MNRIIRSTHLALSTYALLCLGLATPAAFAIAGNCDSDGSCGRMACKAPAQPVPQQLWGELESASSIPTNRDNTAFNEFTQPYGIGHPFWMGVDTDSGFLYAAISHGLQVWDLRTSPADPSLLKVVDATNTLRFWPLGEVKQALRNIDVEGSLGGLVGAAAVGTSLFDFSNPSSPKFLYQDSGYSSGQIYTTTIGASKYAFSASETAPVQGALTGVVVYNMTAASTLSACWQGNDVCPNVRLGSFGGAASYVHGAGNYVVFSRGAGGGVEIWDVSNPAAPTQRLVGTGAGGAYGVALWKNGSSYFLGLRTGSGGSIYNVSCITGGTCSLGAPVWSQAMAGGTSEYYISYSTSGPRQFLYFGNDNKCGSATVPDPQREYLIDVTNPALAHDITPSTTATVQNGGAVTQITRSGSTATAQVASTAVLTGGQTVIIQGATQSEYNGSKTIAISDGTHFTFSVTGGPATPATGTITWTGPAQSLGYWNWYYRKSNSGFNSIMPRAGKFYNDYFYRAAFGILDVHHLAGGVAPVADFTWSPSEVYPGTPVTFTDLSTGSPTAWSWTFSPDGSPASSLTRNPAGVTFAGVGAKAVGLTASNDVGPTSTSKLLAVLDPTPQIPLGGVTMSPPSPLVCQPVTFTSSGVTGKPTLNYSWNVATDPGGTSVVTNPTPSFTWDTTGAAAGAYTSTLQVSNTSGTATRGISFTLGALPTLPASITPTNDPFSAGTVQFHVAAAGATEWSWDFGDGAGFTAWTNDPTNGPNPVHTYATIGTKTVVVKVRNCIQIAGVTSAPLSVNILQIAPLTASFAAQGICSIFGCLATQGQAVTFLDNSGGSPDHWDYDWDGNGTYEDAGHTAPVTSHTFLTLGNFRPGLLVHRGVETKTFVHSMINVSSPTPPSVTISGASSATINNAAALAASGNNCNTSSPTSGWSWSAAGGSIAAPTDAANVSITWTSAGTKTVTATHSACPNAQGTRQVVVSDPNGGGGGTTLAAVFSISPASPAIGQTVTLNGTASTGSPSSYSWTFGDGQSATGSTTTHAYATAGTFTLKLTVTKPGSGTGCFSGVCVAEKAQSVVVGATPLFSVDYSTSASCVNQFGLETCTGNAGTAVSFTATGTGATSYTWSFGDGTADATGATATHTFAAPGSFFVTLTGNDGTTTKTKARAFEIGGPALAVDFTTSASCSSQFGLQICDGETGHAIDFTAVSTTATSLTWNFGDGSAAAAGATAHHTYAAPGQYTVTLTGTDGTLTGIKSRAFNIEGAPVPPSRSVVIPWIGQNPAPGAQVSDLHIFNPTAAPLQVDLSFRKRGTPETNPPKALRTIPAHGALLLNAAQVFTPPNTGFIIAEVEGTDIPVITLVNTRASGGGGSYTQVIPGVPADDAGAVQTAGQLQHILGLGADLDSNSYVGFSNGGDAPAEVRLDFIAKDGSVLSTSDPITLPRLGQKQFTFQQMRQSFSVTGQRDYRVQIESLNGGQILAFGTSRNQSTLDPSFFLGRAAGDATSYLVGVFDTTGVPTALWQTDLVIANPAAAAQSIALTFVPVVGTTKPPVTIDLAAGETKRLANALATTLGAANKTGMVIASRRGCRRDLPADHGAELRQHQAHPALRRGARALRRRRAAGPGEHIALVGLRQDASFDSTFWVAGVGTSPATFDIVFRDYLGHELKRVNARRVPGGAIRQFAGSGVGTAPNGLFTIELVVRSGQVIAAGKVVHAQHQGPGLHQGPRLLIRLVGQSGNAGNFR
jgi:PKD repeat protein